MHSTCFQSRLDIDSDDSHPPCVAQRICKCQQQSCAQDSRYTAITFSPFSPSSPCFYFFPIFFFFSFFLFFLVFFSHFSIFLFFSFSLFLLFSDTIHCLFRSIKRVHVTRHTHKHTTHEQRTTLTHELASRSDEMSDSGANETMHRVERVSTRTRVLKSM